MLRKASAILVGFSLMAAAAPCSEIVYFCRAMGRAAPECCCRAAEVACASADATDCGCCDTLIRQAEGSADAFPLTDQPRIDPPPRTAAGLLTAAPVIAAALAECGPGAWPGVLSPTSPAVPLYLRHCVLLC